jgi:hypothetical protein
VFLCLVLAALAISRRRWTGRSTVVAVSLLGLAAAQVGVLRLFPTSGTYPFHWEDLAAVLGVCTVGALLARRAERGEPIFAFFVVWGLGSIAAFLVPSAIGDNWTRLREFVFPLMLLTASLARFRPRKLAIFALSGALAYNLVPYLMLIPYRLDSRPEHARFWAPALSYVQDHEGPNYRLEVVPTAAHWESYWVPRAGVPIARGWYRQIDIADNPVLYRDRLGPAGYRRWLRSVGVKYVLLPTTKLDPVASPREARLLETEAAGLTPVFHSATGTVYELPGAQPLLTGPGRAHLTTLSSASVAGSVSATGRYTLRVHFNSHWTLHAVATCAQLGPNGMTTLVVSRPGTFELTNSDGVGSILSALLPKGPKLCTSRGTRRGGS